MLYHSHALSLVVQPPAGRSMVIQVKDDPGLLDAMRSEYRDGITWLTVPLAAKAVGPIPYPEYLVHQLGQHAHAKFRALEAVPGQRYQLPPTGIPEKLETEKPGSALC